MNPTTNSVLGICVLLGIAGCDSSPQLPERFDTRTGITWLTEQTMMVFARTEASYSRSARDYVYLGPVEVNTRGTREHFLWVGIATTLDRGFLAPNNPPPDTISFVVAGEPIQFELEAWGDSVPGLATADPYEPKVRPTAQLAARVTRDLLRLISDNGVDFVRIGLADERAREYFLWSPASEWAGFSARSDSR